MSFGFGVGDVLAVSKLARSMWKRFQDSSDQFKALRTEAANLCLVLDDVAQTVPGRELSDQEARTLSLLIEGCRDVIGDMNTMLQKFEKLGTSSSSPGARSQKAWRKLRWDPDEVNELRSRVTSNTVSLDAFNSSLASKTSQAVKDNLTELTNRQDQQELQAIINWLSPLQFPAQQSDFISRRQRGTGQWLLQSDQFNTWLNTTRKTLFCSGIPGAGKTMLAAIVIDHLCDTIQKVDIGVVYIYCNYKAQFEQTLVNLIASLLKQLLQQQGVVSNDLKSLYRRHLKKETRPTLDEVFNMLQSEMNRYTQVFVVIDALDECPVESRVRQDLLSKLNALQASHSVSLMATSRIIPDIMQEFQTSLHLKIRASEEDVRSYLDGQMFRLAHCVKRNNNLQEVVKENIVNAVHGMFLLAQLHLDSLVDKTSPKAIKTALGKLPQGSDALDRAYDQAMTRIDNQEAGFRQLADQVLSWITYAQRPLTIVEFQHALAIEEGEPKLDRENITDVEELVSVCLGLVAIDKETNIIRLVHYTTQEYFRQIRMQRFPNAQRTIAATCLTYLSFDVFAKVSRATYYIQGEEVRSRLKQNPFLEYAAHHWSAHAQGDVEQEVSDQMMTLLTDKCKVLNCSQVLTYSSKHRYFQSYDSSKAYGISKMHLTAIFGLRDTMSLLLGKGIETDLRDYYGRSPLSCASEFGHDAVLVCLLNRGAAVGSTDEFGRTPLSYAAKYGHKAVVELLLARGAAVDSKDNQNRTPLSYAVRNGNEAMMELLLTRGAAVDSKDKLGRTPLSTAAHKRHKAVVELLLAREAAVDSKDNNNETPLLRVVARERGRHNLFMQIFLQSTAEKKKYKVMVDLLLSRGAAVDSKDDKDRTPLSYAAGFGHEAVGELLLNRGAAVDSKDVENRTPLSYAATEGYEAVVELLLARGAAVDSKDDKNRTPLSYAVNEGYKAMVELLLTRGAAVDSIDTLGRTPLSYAAHEGYKALVELLLTRGAAVDLKDNKNETPLLYAAAGKRARNRLYKRIIPQRTAVEKEYEVVVELLLNRGAAVDSMNTSSRTPLSHAAQEGCEAVVELLLAQGAAADSKDKSGRTPLSYARSNYHEAVAKLLQNP